MYKGFYCHAKTSLSGGITSYGKGNAEYVQSMFVEQAKKEQGYISFPGIFHTYWQGNVVHSGGPDYRIKFDTSKVKNFGSPENFY